MHYSQKVGTAAVIGLGTIGASWAAYFLARGIAVRAYDRDAAAEAHARDFIARAWPTLAEMDLIAPGADPERFTFHLDLRSAVAGADFVQENAPESAALKTTLFTELGELCAASVPIATSTSALRLSPLVVNCRHRERFFVGHPFNPPHIVPLVELVGGEHTSEEVLDWAVDFYRGIQRQPVRLRREIYGHIANRLQYVIFNEAFRMLQEGVASVEDIDAAVSWGPGMRWALFGPFMSMHLGGGKGGLAAAFEKFRERDSFNTDRAARLMLTPDQQAMLIAGVEQATRGRTVEELEAMRNQALVDIYRIKAAKWDDGREH